MIGGGSDVPVQSEEEKALQVEQTELLRQQREISQQVLEQQQLLQPILFEQAGIKTITDEEGNITGFESDDPNKELRQGIETSFLERTQQALAGELPVNPALMRQLEEEENKLNEELRKDFGSIEAARTSTPGLERIDRFNRFRTEVLESARRGDLTLAEQLSVTRQGANLGISQGRISLPSQVAALPQTAGLFQTSQIFGSAVQQRANVRLQTGAIDAEGGDPFLTALGAGAGFYFSGGNPAGAAAGASIGSQF